ncbi:hypothetical protein GCM10022286_22220 [Gryllotalpicola daejeonensis]|uniref:DUF4340 domain-containing protein n=1 Tax=Gryllotalpicola daejeonensis TaxID=993087 RepID=A0ABP7ZL98_9MICO
MTNDTERDLRLDRASSPVSGVLFSEWSVEVELGDSSLILRAPFGVTWADGSVAPFDPRSVASNPDAARLLSELLGAKVTRSVAGVERSYLQVEFDNGARIHFEPADSGWEEWEVRDFEDVLYIGLPHGETAWFTPAPKQAAGATSKQPSTAAGATTTPETPAPAPAPSPAADEPAWYDGDEPRVIDLEISDHIYGVTIFGASVQLETRGGSIYLAGPFQVTDSSGEVFEFDPTRLRDDTVAGAILSVLIDRKMGQITLKPDTSELTVTLASGAGLSWKASSAAQAQFSAKLRNGRQFWSKGDGTIYWFGGPEGTQPKFLVGGPKATD